MPGVITARITKTAKKQNGAKSNGRSDVWDLPYLFEYVDNEDIGEMELSDLTNFVITRLKGFSGWRSADLTGIYHEHSFDFIHDPADTTKVKALRVRTFSSKVQKGQWSRWLTLPVLHSRLKHICPVRALLKLISTTRGYDLPTVAAQHPDTGARIEAKPLFIYKTRSGYAQLKADSVASKFRKLFLENVTTQRGGNDIKLSMLYTAHTSRNAVASALNDMEVPANNIAAHMNTTADNLRSTYITTVLRDWELPRACIAHHELLAAKLAVPYAHYLATQGDASRACNCNDLFASVPQP